MLFSEKMSRVPQPRRADLWAEYRVLCTALALRVRLRKESRMPTAEELNPLKEAAEKANQILLEHGMDASFFPEKEDFFEGLLGELALIMNSPSEND